MTTVNEQAMVTHDGKWFTVYAPAVGPNGFTVGWVADDSGKFIQSFRGQYKSVDDLLKEVCAFLDR